jgi:hypothetical protein
MASWDTQNRHMVGRVFQVTLVFNLYLFLRNRSLFHGLTAIGKLELVPVTGGAPTCKSLLTMTSSSFNSLATSQLSYAGLLPAQKQTRLFGCQAGKSVVNTGCLVSEGIELLTVVYEPYRCLDLLLFPGNSSSYCSLPVPEVHRYRILGVCTLQKSLGSKADSSLDL